MEHLNPNGKGSNQRGRTSRLARRLRLSALALALLCLLAVLIGALGSRPGWWSYRNLLGVLVGVFWVALLACLNFYKLGEWYLS